MSTYNDAHYANILSAIRANKLCKKERKTFNMIHSTTSGQIEPGIAKNAAIDLIDCLDRVNQNSRLIEPRKNALQCLKSNGKCQSLVQAYANLQ